MKNYNAMSDAEINEKINALSAILDRGIMGDEWDEAYNEYFRLRAIQDERYRLKNIDAFEAFYTEHIEGKSWEEIDPDAWQTYSDWHKDMYGFRPHSI